MSDVDEKATDGLEAALVIEAVAPKHPCPKCGNESSPHGEPAWHDENERICSSDACRKVQPAPEEVVPVDVNADNPPRFPCVDCKRETKVHRSGRKAAQSVERVCLDCRTIFKP
jgi:predicted RNA-binding Zn-ribbon protein involved in translation (DUF1610 family)